MTVNVQEHQSTKKSDVKTTETEIKLKLRQFPTSLPYKSSVRILQNYYDPTNEAVKNVLRSALSTNVNSELHEIENAIVSATEVRSRMSLMSDNTVSYKITLKTDGDLSRTDVEVPINQIDYDILRTTEACIGTVLKTRKKVPVSMNRLNSDSFDTPSNSVDLTLEVDEYEGALDGLVTAEVEFNPSVCSYDEVVAFTMNYLKSFENDVDVVDVTLNKAFKNKNLAIKQRY